VVMGILTGTTLLGLIWLAITSMHGA
jgi:hypothetical protein